MKKINYLLMVIAAVAILASCIKDTSNLNFFKVNSNSFRLNVGYIDNTYNSNLTASPVYRPYAILLQDQEVNPANYIKFMVYSTSTTELATGTYIYSFSDITAGKFSYFEYGYGILWDNVGVETAGTFFMDSSDNIVDGSSITISRNSADNYVFDINMQVIVNGSTKTITGRFSEVLNQSSNFPVYQY